MRKLFVFLCAMMLIVAGMEVVVVAQQIAPMPEPSTMLLFGSGLIGLLALRNKFTK